MNPAQRSLFEDATDVLSANDIGGRTKAAPSLYPHQWSWDSAFIAIGLAHVDARRAAGELDTLFGSQWRNGMVPHIVYDPAAPSASYFPEAERWRCASVSPDAPAAPPDTSGICQPPVHAIAAHRILETGEPWVRGWLEQVYPRLLAWHRYLVTARDPEGSGLVTIYHPWESGTDNSPRWDIVMGRLVVGEMPPYTRYDLEHVRDAAERPSDTEYDYFVWLLERLKDARYDDAVIYRSHPFLVKDVLFSAILVAATDALLEVATAIDAPAEDRDAMRAWIARGRRALLDRIDPDVGLCLDLDLRTGMALRASTVAGLSPLIAGGLPDDVSAALVKALESEWFVGDPRLRWPLPPSASPRDPGFRSRNYSRGPVWPMTTWLVWFGLQRVGETARAEAIRSAALAQLEESGLAECFEPFTGEPLGSNDQSWSAAIALDWLCGRASVGRDRVPGPARHSVRSESSHDRS